MQITKTDYDYIHCLIVCEDSLLFQQSNYNVYFHVIFSDLKALFPLTTIAEWAPTEPTENRG